MKLPLPLTVTLDPKPVEDALTHFKAKRASIAELRATIKKWERELENFIATGNPTDDRHAGIVTHLKGKLEMAPNYLRRDLDQAGPLAEALLKASTDFEEQLANAVSVEREALLDHRRPVHLQGPL